MMFEFVPMTIQSVHHIETWEYEGHMKSIDMDAYVTHYQNYGEATRGPGNCFGFAVMSQDHLMGLFEYYPQPNLGVEIGLALAPEYVGKGLSKHFIHEGIAFGLSFGGWDPNEVRLEVEVDNMNAYHAYLKSGFEVERIEGNSIHMHWIPSSREQ